MRFTFFVTLMAAAVSAAPALNALDARKTNKSKPSKPAPSVPVSGSGSDSGNSSSTGGAGSVSGMVTEACNIGYATLNGGTKGGAGGSQTTVTSLAELKKAAGASGPAIITINGALTGNEVVDVTSDKTVIGAAGSSLTGVGLRVKRAKNVIIRNIKISKVLASAGDAIAVQFSSNVWLDHLDLSSDRDHDKDYYDGLLDVTHASDYITISNCLIHDHWKAILIGHSDTNAAEDTGHLIVTLAYNYLVNINSRGPSFRFGTGHIYNHVAENSSTGINARMGAHLLVESAVFSNIEKPLESADSPTVGDAVVKDCNLGAGTNTVKAGSLTSVPYKYSLIGSASVRDTVVANAGQTLKF